MHGRSFVAVIAASGLALAFAERISVAAAAETLATAEQPAATSPGATNAQPSPTAHSPNAAVPSSATPNPPAPGAATPPPPASAALVQASDTVIVSIRGKLGDPALRKGADAKDLAALEAFYAQRSGSPVWMTPMG